MQFLHDKVDGVSTLLCVHAGAILLHQCAKDAEGIPVQMVTAGALPLVIMQKVRRMLLDLE